MTRWKASAIHLTLSVLVLCTIAAVLVWRWYPPGLFHMANADKLLLIIAGVIGGLVGFGVMGLFVGPVILAASYTLVKSWVAEGPAVNPGAAP